MKNSTEVSNSTTLGILGTEEANSLVKLQRRQEFGVSKPKTFRLAPDVLRADRMNMDG